MLGDVIVKKIIIFWVCLLLIGCQTTSSDTMVDESQWEGTYHCGDVTLSIGREDDYDGLVFNVEYNLEGYQDYAYFQDDQHLEAISDLTEDGYTLEFTLQENKVIVKESGGQSYLGIELSGEYIKE